MKDAQSGSVFDELLSFCYHVADRVERKIELAISSDRDTPANFGTMPRRAGVYIRDNQRRMRETIFDVLYENCHSFGNSIFLKKEFYHHSMRIAKPSAASAGERR